MRPCPAAFAVPGEIDALTGGYLYDRRVLDGLRGQGRDVELIRLAPAFPDPGPADLGDAARRLAAVAPDRPLIVDGLALGVLPPEVLDAIRAPLVALVHHPLARESGLGAARRAQLHRTERAALARARAVIVTGPHGADLLTRDYGVDAARITIARPGTDRPDRPQCPTDPPLILSVGIRVPRKGHDVLLAALARIAGLPWRAVIVGGRRDARHADALDAVAAAPELHGRVRFAGEIGPAALATLYAEATLFALATRYEGYGLVFDEAMARGLPVVSCRTGAVPRTLAAEAALLAPPDDPAAFAEALARVLTDTPLRTRMAAASARAGAALPSWTGTVERIGAALDQVAQGAPARHPPPEARG